jgi:hypothetical protein
LKDPTERIAAALEDLVYRRRDLDTLTRIEHAIAALHRDVRRIQLMEVVNMALGQDILDAVAAETTVLDSFLTLIDGLVKNNTVSQAVADQIKAAIASNKTKIEAAIVANTPAAP